MVPPAEYFAKCFGNTKKTGTDTEYCEQVVPALHFGDDEIIDGVSCPNHFFICSIIKFEIYYHSIKHKNFLDASKRVG